MGNFDKLVSLTVLFLVAIVLGVTLNSPSCEEDEASVLDDSDEELKDNPFGN